MLLSYDFLKKRYRIHAIYSGRCFDITTNNLSSFTFEETLVYVGYK